MNIVKQEGLFYELLIRGVHDPASGKLGDFQEAHYVEGAALLDTDANQLVAPYVPGIPQVLPREKVTELLGEKFAGLEEQLRIAQDAAAAANEDLVKTRDALAGATGERDALNTALTAEQAAHAETKTKLGATIADREQELADLRRQSAKDVAALRAQFDQARAVSLGNLNQIAAAHGAIVQALGGDKPA